MVEPKTVLRQHLVQGLGLRQRAREAVENKAVSAVAARSMSPVES
jgi:hypothetical protein